MNDLKKQYFENYNYYFEQLDQYNIYDGERFWNIGYDGIKKGVEKINNDYADLAYEWNKKVLYSLNKINDYKKDSDSLELKIYIEYLNYKIQEGLNMIYDKIKD